MRLLHVDSSARPRSLSRQLSAELVSSLREGGEVAYVHRDLAADPVPHINAAWTEICDNLLANGIVDLDRLHEGVHTPSQREAWSVVEPLLEEVLHADVILLATPMYNYSIPSALKAWIDQITFPRMVLAPRRFVVVAARGGAYAEGTPKGSVEHQTRYLSDLVQGHFGVEGPACVHVDLGNSTVDPLLFDRRQQHEDSLEVARASVRTVALQLREAQAGR